MTTTPDLEHYMDTPPAGAVWVDAWEGASFDRARVFTQAPFDVGAAILTIRGMQFPDGRTDRSILIELHEEIRACGEDLTPQDARRLAAMLQNFADTCEILDQAAR
jgi:hypothetical protein